MEEEEKGGWGILKINPPAPWRRQYSQLPWLKSYTAQAEVMPVVDLLSDEEKEE